MERTVHTDGHTAPALTLRGVSKRYGPVVACDAVDLAVRPGEIHGLLGENGAGKSTLMKILLGLVHRDAGSILRDGEPVEIDTPQRAADLGLGMVHQHFSLIDPLTVWENVIMGDSGRVDKGAACAQVEQVAQRYGLPIDPMARVDRLSAGERQRVELIKCLRRDPSVLILDEPTSVLTQAESAELFTVLRRVVQAENRAVILISHKLAEIIAATDRVTVLRRGAVVFHGPTAQTTPQLLARQMVGREVSLRAESAALGMLPVDRSGDQPAGDQPSASGQPAAGSPPALRLRDVTVLLGELRILDALNLDVAPGEIVGLYGVEGNGQATLGDLLSGLLVPDSGTVEIGGEPVDLDRAGALHTAGLGIVPEDRHRSGVVLDMTIAENLVMKSLAGVSGAGGVLSRRRIQQIARQRMTEFNIIAPSPDTPVRSLSGGNQQRVVLARELSAGPRVLIAAQPTHGLDVGAIEDMYVRLRQAAAEGVAVLLISTELEEVMALSDRVAVISSGRIVGVLDPAEATAERLGMLVGGVSH
ncbi:MULTISPECIES: ABC transporter ATP-binding protein [unclassified Solwaraspora]|uniref:ABC transporter ATP-binding protein n=1 Tax=unclassified Solwaraspora TaxID=2627926 RepID=UPI00248BFF3E|nr:MULTISPECIES: ABC transporter ATP-binding protein [unclassified Solwaraspora]WBB95514.1 ABC transporter ATP-binding protein [Solwaraspora sp. WMMA2059]WBC20581.1 ABC transporter ATP-binding protein [Solwaraspora sp. WMMA2080]WJK37286.1 ABC transporter ATP-binding protein [Solwaraspora sp. WMMA2065]